MGTRKMGIGAVCAVLCVLIVAAALAACGSSSSSSSVDRAPALPRRWPSASSCRSPATARCGARRSWPASRWSATTSTRPAGSRSATTPTMFTAKAYDNSGIRPSRRPSRARPCRTACATSCRGPAQRSWPRTPPNGARPFSRSSPPPTRSARAPSTRTTTTAGSTTPTTCRSCTRTPRRSHPDFQTGRADHHRRRRVDSGSQVPQAVRHAASASTCSIPVKIAGGETDFYPVLTPLIKKGVDIIDVASPGPEDAALHHQAGPRARLQGHLRARRRSRHQRLRQDRRLAGRRGHDRSSRVHLSSPPRRAKPGRRPTRRRPRATSRPVRRPTTTPSCWSRQPCRRPARSTRTP